MGRLATDPEKRQSANGITVTSFVLAIDRRGQDAGADFIRCKAFGKAADAIAQYVSKGRRFAVVGRIQTGSYETQEGRRVNTFEVIVDTFEFCDSQQSSQGSQNNRPAPQPAQNQRQTRPTAQRNAPERFDGFMSIPDGIDEELPFS